MIIEGNLNETFIVCYLYMPIWRKHKEKMSSISVFNKLFHRDFMLQLVILWPLVTPVWHTLYDNYFKVKTFILFSITYCKLLVVIYCFY